MRSTKPTTNNEGENTTATTSDPILSIPFSHIIEADHTSISHLATLTIARDTPLPVRLATLTTLLCRLIRHDISEELVMRPAFTQYLGPDGVAFAEQDRVDHADLKGRLVELYESVHLAVRRGEGVDVDEGVLVGRVRALGAEMATHMREESGGWLLRLEGVLGTEVSLGLGARYARTLVLTEEVRDGDEGGLCFGGVMEYVRADMDVFRGILGRLEERDRVGGDGGYLRRRVREELGVMKFIVEEDPGQGGVASKRSREKL